MAEQRNVVIAMDGSEYSTYALDWYEQNVRTPSDHVILVHCPEYYSVIQSPFTGDLASAAARAAKEEDKVMVLLEKLRDRLKEKKMRGKVVSEGGKTPGETVLKIAEREDARLIITGSRGNGTVRRTILGSVSDYIMHHSHIPVLVCRHKEHHQRHQDHYRRLQE